jgi:hypothetical protein
VFLSEPTIKQGGLHFVFLLISLCPGQKGFTFSKGETFKQNLSDWNNVCKTGSQNSKNESSDWE